MDIEAMKMPGVFVFPLAVTSVKLPAKSTFSSHWNGLLENCLLDTHSSFCAIVLRYAVPCSGVASSRTRAKGWLHCSLQGIVHTNV